MNQIVGIPTCRVALPETYPTNKTLICNSSEVAPVPEAKPQLTEAQLSELFSQLDGKLLTCRLASCISQPLQLEGLDHHAQCFNEVVRRISTDEQRKIMNILSAMTDDHIETIVQCCDDPSLMTRNNYELLKSFDFPYQLLRAFRDEKITVNEFATMISLHGIYQENVQLKAGFELQFKRLFDHNGQPIEASWELIAHTLRESNEKGFIFRFDVDHIIKTMQEKLATVRPVEAIFWHYPIAKSSVSTVADIIRGMGVWALSRFADQEMVSGISTRQALLDAAFEKEAHRINPVIGTSSVADIRKGGSERHRDFALPFPDIPLPKKADGIPAPFIIDFLIHDYYHLLRVSLLDNEDVDLYLAIGDKLKRQRDRYHHGIGELKLICKKKLTAYAEFNKRIDKLSVEQRQKAMARLGRDFYKVSRLITYLKKARKATGQYKARLYDMEIPGSNYKQSGSSAKLCYLKASRFPYHIDNLLFLLSSDYEGCELLDGMPAEIAGRIVIPMISGGLMSPRAQFLKLDQIYTYRLRVLKTNPAIQDKMVVQKVLRKVHRSKRFIAALNRATTTLK